MYSGFRCRVCDEVLGNAVDLFVHRIVKNNSIILKYTAFFVNWNKGSNMVGLELYVLTFLIRRRLIICMNRSTI